MPGSLAHSPACRPCPVVLQSGYAWSGSDSGDDGDPLGLLGVAFEGAVSPGFSDGEAAGHEEQDRWGPQRWQGPVHESRYLPAAQRAG